MVRYMAFNSTSRKFDSKRYIEQMRALTEGRREAGPPPPLALGQED
jgi:hypothetical protein